MSSVSGKDKMVGGSTRGPRDIKYYMALSYSVLLHKVEDEGENYWMAEIPELSGCASDGDTVEEALRNVEEAKREWILDALDAGDEVPIPVDREAYAGKVLVRMSSSLHRDLSMMSEAEGLSLNQLIVTFLSRQLGRSESRAHADTKAKAARVASSGTAEMSPLQVAVSEKKGRYGKKTPVR